MKDQKIATNFSKGLNLSVSHMIGLEELQVADNFMFSDGAFVREGTVVNASLPFPVVSLKKHYKRDGTAYIAAFAGGKAYLSYTSGVFVNVSCETLASGDISVVAYDDYLYFTNLSNAVKSFNGSSIDNAGLSGPVFIKYLSDFDNTSNWVATSSLIAKDLDYLHIDRGDNSLLFTVNTSTGNIYNSANLDLTSFVSGVPSSGKDMIQIFTVTNQKANISTLNLVFANAGGGIPTATANITVLSSWVYSSNDSWSMTHTIPKDLFAVTSGFTWGSCLLKLSMWSVASQAAVSVDNARLVKTPPIVSTKMISGGGLYFGYAAAQTDRYAAPTDLQAGLVQPIAWTALSSSPLGMVSTITSASPSLANWKTSGQVSMQRPQEMQSSLFIFAFI